MDQLSQLDLFRFSYMAGEYATSQHPQQRYLGDYAYRSGPS